MIATQEKTTVPLRIRPLSAAITIALLSPAGETLAQEEEVEEVLVTGSYIQNSAFAQNSPVDTLTAEDIQNSGAPSMDQYMRDLAYTSNTDAVNNVLGGDAGPQTSEGASFNLRGLGENSTLTLADGVRTVNDTMNALFPDVAINRMEVVLDGGSALYGSDAVAGVVNLIPIKEFDGVRVRSRYTAPEDGANEEGTIGAIAGTTMDNGVNLVGALEFRKRTSLQQIERPREFLMDDGSSASGNPGAYREVFGGTVNPGGPHGGTLDDHSMLDPSCGTFNPGGPNPSAQDRMKKFNTPSGVPQNQDTSTPWCRYQYTNPYDYATALESYNAYANATWNVSDRLQLEMMGNYYLLKNGPDGSTTTALNANNRAAVLVPADHPANPYGVDVSPYHWRPITGALGTNPDWIPDQHNNGNFMDHDRTYRVTIGGTYDFAGSWTSSAYYSQQEFNNTSTTEEISLTRLQQALNGNGGHHRDQYYNPFGSSDPRSPFYEEGVTDNSREIMNWVFPERTPFTGTRDKLRVAQATATGQVFQLPAGALSMAAGIQRREVEDINYEDEITIANDDYYRDISQPPIGDTHFYSDVNAAFLEFEAPIIPGLALQAAARHEQFTTFDLKSTTPKLALRWEATPSLAIRTSWGESFLAPTPFQARPFVPDENCGESFSGNDPFLDRTLVGSASCSSGNPNLQPEQSEIFNFGATWEPGGVMSGLSVSLDYQQVEYDDRIRTLDDTDAVFAQFDEFLDQQGITADQYDPTPGSATREAAENYLRSVAGTGNPVRRDPDTLVVQRIFTQAANISSVYIDLIDLSASYTLNTQEFGTFSADLNTSQYIDYRYKDLNEVWTDALGNQNHSTGIVPPVPKIKAQLGLDWLSGPHTASMTANYRHHVLFDALARDNYNDGFLDTIDSHIDRETIVDARYAYNLENLLNSPITVSAGVNNMFDMRPERLPIQGGFETRLSVPWGRQFWMSVDWRPGF